MQESDNLTGWNSAGSPVQVDIVDQGNGTELIRYRSSKPIANYPDGKVFMRLRVIEQ